MKLLPYRHRNKTRTVSPLFLHRLDGGRSAIRIGGSTSTWAWEQNPALYRWCIQRDLGRNDDDDDDGGRRGSPRTPNVLSMSHSHLNTCPSSTTPECGVYYRCIAVYYHERSCEILLHPTAKETTPSSVSHFYPVMCCVERILNHKDKEVEKAFGWKTRNLPICCTTLQHDHYIVTHTEI